MKGKYVASVQCKIELLKKSGKDTDARKNGVRMLSLYDVIVSSEFS